MSNATLQDLELNLVRHCNWSCKSCNHFSPLAERWFMEPAEAERDLSILSKVSHWAFVCAQGGEVTLHPRLPEFLTILHRSGIADQVGMLTNGSLLERLPEAFWKTAAKVNLELRCSVYAKLPEHIVPFAEAKCAEYGIKFRSWKTDGFLPMFKKHEDRGQVTWEKCPWKRCWTLHCGYLYFCPQSAFMPGQFPEMFDGRPGPFVDGYPLSTLTPEMIDEMLVRPHALKSCEICVGHGAEARPWAESPRERETWIKEATL